MSAPARIGMVLTTMGYGGVPEVVLQLMRHLPRDRFEPTLCVLKHESSEGSICGEREARFEALGLEVHYAAASSRKLETVASVASWIDRQRLAVLHTHSNRPNVFGRLAGTLCRPSGLRIVAHYHNQYDDKWEREPAMLALEQRLAATTDAMIAVSESVREHVAARVGIAAEKIDVVANGIDSSTFAAKDRRTARQALGLDQSRPVLGLVGRVCEQKGQEDFVEAAIRFSTASPDALFLMVGHVEDEALHRRLQQRIAAVGHGERIRFLGNVDDMATVYAALDLVVAPSRWEGFGMMLVEAMAAGRPIVATRTGAIPEIVTDGETARLVPPRDPAALAAAMAQLMADPVQRAAFGAAGRRTQGRFTWTRAAERTAEIYDRVLAASVPS